METTWKAALWQQFGAAIDMLDNAVAACPDALWGDRARAPQFWYLTFHTLFWLDYYLSQPTERYQPPAPFGLEELDPAGVLPPRVYSKDELRAYLARSRRKCRATIEALTPQQAAHRYRFRSSALPIDELLVYNLRHVQHGAAQLNLLLRQYGAEVPRWVKQAKAATS